LKNLIQKSAEQLKIGISFLKPNLSNNLNTMSIFNLRMKSHDSKENLISPKTIFNVQNQKHKFNFELRDTFQKLDEIFDLVQKMGFNIFEKQLFNDVE
jgi:hypothetical protein